MDKGAKLLATGLERIRKERGWKQKDLADALGMAPANVSRLFSEEARDPQLETVIKYAQKLSIDVSELLKANEQAIPSSLPLASPSPSPSKLLALGSILFKLAPLDETKLGLIDEMLDSFLGSTSPGP